MSEYQEIMEIIQEEQQMEFEAETSEKLIETVKELTEAEGVQVEKCGIYIWISGNTRPIKETLKTLGYYWACKKEQWYWKPKEYRRPNRRPLPMDQIRNKYGSETLDNLKMA